ncbi:USP [Symbiodinium necroappetens]|uniref:USP protein n=1 Tax=Symbiodinium necroappetens TaxID=1628268 RepID=A0A812Z9Z8_9DINO|nr:USP [Symbiodinium necroappetens]
MKSLSLEQLQRRFDRLRSLQRRLARAPATHFIACGKRYDLPLSARTAKPCADVIPPRIVDYMAGFFDGDGCVSRHKDKYQLSVGQAESGSEVLLLFRNLLGGGIYAKGRAQGTRQVTLQWSVFSKRAQHAAAKLSRSSCFKHEKLWLAAALPERSRQNGMKPSRALCRSWSYLAGFFDAEGSIRIRYPAGLTLQIGQTSPYVLFAIQDFLARTGIQCSVHEYSGRHLLEANRTEECRLLLKRLLTAGLRVKRHAARVSLELAPGNFHHVRSKLQEVVGLQSRYRRLTAAGAERAYEIQKTRTKIDRGGGIAEIERPRLVQSQLMNLQATHRLKCAEERYVLLRADIRSQLRQGACIGNS